MVDNKIGERSYKPYKNSLKNNISSKTAKDLPF
jgi:hypothetical protein